jgi:hypothetical protein
MSLQTQKWKNKLHVYSVTIKTKDSEVKIEFVDDRDLVDI